MRKRAVLRPPQFQIVNNNNNSDQKTETPRTKIKQEVIVPTTSSTATTEPIQILRIVNPTSKGKGRFGKRAPPLGSNTNSYQYERHIEDNSNDSGFECDWNSQSESQFAWSYSSSSNILPPTSHHTTASQAALINHLEDSSNHSVKSAPGCISIPKFPAAYLEHLSSSDGLVGGKKLVNLGHVAAPAVGGYSSTAAAGITASAISREEDMSNDGRITDLKLQFVSSAGKLSPGKTSITMPGRGSVDPTNTSTGMPSTTGSNTPRSHTAASTPSPVKRPRLCFSPPSNTNNSNANESKGSGLKLRNQNGVHHVRNSVGKRLPPGTTPSLTSPLGSVSRDGRVQLQILSQPEEQHRARYQTEGSRGAIKDRKCNGFPTVKLFGYDKPATLQIFIGTDQGKVSPHMFYQACKVTGKSSTPCIEKTVEGTVVIEIEFEPSKEMVISCDCVGILKARNVDVEQRFPFHHASATQSRKKSTKCRMVFRTTIINSLGQEETLQVASLPILCTQPPGQPEICKQSMMECPASGGKELFVIGKNFLKDSTVVVQEENQGEVVWEAKVVPLKDYLQQTHLICVIPGYKEENITSPVDCRISIWSGGKLSEPHRFTYVPNISNTVGMGGVGAAAVGTAPPALGLVSSLDSPDPRTLSSVQHSLTMSSPVSVPEMQQQHAVQVQSVATVMSPEHMVGSSIVSPGQVSCHMSPSSSSLDSPVLAPQMCSPVDQSMTQHMMPLAPATTNGPLAPTLSFDTTMMTSLPPTQSAYTTTVDELKTLLEQSAHQDQQNQQAAQQQQQHHHQQQHCADVTTVTATTTAVASTVDVKQEVMLSPVMDMKPATTNGMSPTMSAPVTMDLTYQDESSMSAVGVGTNAVTTTTASGYSPGSRYPVDPILSSVNMPLMNGSPNNLSPINPLVVNENSQHSMHMPPMMTSSSAVPVGPTTIEGLVTAAAAAAVGQVPMTLPPSTMSCMEPMLKTDAGATGAGGICRPVTTSITTTAGVTEGGVVVGSQQPQQQQQGPGGNVVFINSELQGPLANALTQMSDNELINYINPSCFDQGAF